MGVDTQAIFTTEQNSYLDSRSFTDNQTNTTYTFIKNGIDLLTLPGEAEPYALYLGNEENDVFQIDAARAIINGGAGNDTYQFTSADFGGGLLFDTDGLGELFVDGKRLSDMAMADATNENLWHLTSEDPNTFEDGQGFDLLRITDDLLLSLSGELEGVTLKGFFAGIGELLGLSLEEVDDGVFSMPSPTNIVPYFYGDGILEGTSQNDEIAQNPFSGGYAQITIQGGAGDDVIRSTAFGSLLKGGSGNDFIVGGDLDSTLNGGSGNDHLSASGGDVGHAIHMIGGAGNDTFSTSFGYYVIEDFQTDHANERVSVLPAWMIGASSYAKMAVA